MLSQQLLDVYFSQKEQQQTWQSFVGGHLPILHHSPTIMTMDTERKILFQQGQWLPALSTQITAHLHFSLRNSQSRSGTPRAIALCKDTVIFRE